MSGVLSPKVGIIIIFATIVVSYAFYRTHGVIIGPEIVLDSPANGATLSSPFIEINGKALRANRVTMNGRAVTVSEDGEIRETFLLSYGYNAVTLAAEDRYGRKTDRLVELVYR